MTIAFTICSNNYLAHAKTLGDSFLQYHPEAKFIIGLVDKISEDFDFSFFDAFEIIPVEKLKMVEFEDLHNKYNITELNTAVKPALIHYIYKNHGAGKLLYIDPDILVTSRFEEVLNLLDTNNIVLTPHLCTPIDDEFAPTDYHTLRGGVFNLGFIALNNYPEIIEFIDWWHDRVVKYGFADFHQNMFYDQLWINYVPVMFEKYFILKHPGYNMAVWNLHERFLEKDIAGHYIVNGKYPLRFFHFSSYKFTHPNRISTSPAPRFNFETRPDLKIIFEEYQNKLIQNKVTEISKLKVFYYPLLGASTVHKKDSFFKRVNNRIKLTSKVLVKGNL